MLDLAWKRKRDPVILTNEKKKNTHGKRGDWRT